MAQGKLYNSAFVRINYLMGKLMKLPLGPNAPTAEQKDHLSKLGFDIKTLEENRIVEEGFVYYAIEVPEHHEHLSCIKKQVSVLRTEYTVLYGDFIVMSAQCTIGRANTSCEYHLNAINRALRSADPNESNGLFHMWMTLANPEKPDALFDEAFGMALAQADDPSLADRDGVRAECRIM